MLDFRSAPTWLRAASLGVAVAASCVPAAAAGQSNCTFAAGSRSFQSVNIPGQGQIFYLGTPNFTCADGVRIRADSAVAYQSQNVVFFMGSVRFRDPQRILLSDQARYFTRLGRLQAEGHLVVRDTVRGSVIENGEMVYLRQTAQREQEQITVVTGVDHVRPTATLYMRPAADSAATAQDSTVVPDSSVVPDSAAVGDSTVVVDSTVVPDSTVVLDSTVVPDSTVAREMPAPDTAGVAEPDPAVRLRNEPPAPDPEPEDTVQVPFQVEADNLYLQGDEYFLATGTVYIARDSVYARADSAEYDQAEGHMLLNGSAHVESASYELQGQNIDIGMVGGEMRTVRAVHRAELVGEDLQLDAPVILLFLSDGAPERLVAIPLRIDAETLEEPDSVDRVRPVALAERFRLAADSVEVMAPGDVLERIFATGKARGDSSSRDSLNVESLPAMARTDWLEGDTVIAFFVPTAPSDPLLPADTTRDAYELERLVAVGSARSLYRLLPSDSTFRSGVDAPAVHYVTGASITITMLGGEVDLMEVQGPTQGWHLEPEGKVAQGDSVLPDTSQVPPDTVGVLPDTTSVGMVGSVGTGRGRAGPGDRGPPRHGGSSQEDAALPAAAFRGRGRERRSGR